MTFDLTFTGPPAAKPKRQRVLDFDTESRPLSYLGNDWTTGEITAIAARFIGERGPTYVWVLGVQCQHPYTDAPDGSPYACLAYHNGDSPLTMLEGFRELYDAADVVTGHYIRAHDLPLLNGALLEHGLPPLSDKLAHDTKLDLRKRSKLSVSQENLASTLGLVAPKVQMNTPKWREANRLTPDGIELTRKRVVGDVRQHIALRRELLDRGWLNPPRVWRSSGAKAEAVA